MDKLNMMSKDGVQENIEKIKELFPNAVTEVLRDGKPMLAVDFDVLKQEMSSVLIDDKEERYQFTWPDKKKSVLLANTPISATLRPCKEGSVDFDNTENLYIEGDNLDVLKLLQETYLGKIKMIYIDPPYNTGNDFVYEDDFTADRVDYLANSGQYDDQGNRLFQNTESNGRFHTDWLNMIYPRLKLAKDLLSDDGVIFISIDEREFANLKKISDEVFGEKNYFGDLVWESTTQPINAGNARFGLQKKTEIILFYGKNKQENKCFILHELESSLNYPHDGKHGKCRFEIIEKSDAGDYSRPSMRFQILGQFPREGKRWQVGEDLARKLEKEGKVELIDGIVKRAIYPEDEIDKRQFKPFWSLFSASEVGTAQTGKEELNSLFNKQIGFDTVKPISLIKKLIYHVSASLNSDIILDFFSGSATTAHAVMQLNAEDGGNRKFIMVQLPEACDETSEAYKAGYKNICEIGKARIRRAGKKIKEQNPLATTNRDTGFRVLKLDSSNMKPVYYKPEDYTQDLLTGLEDNIKEDRTPMDLLFQAMLELGKPLSAKIEEKVIGDKKVFVVNDDDLIACFDSNITEEVVKQIALMKPLYVVFRDSSMANDSVNTNFEQIFATYSPNTIRKVL